MNQNEKRTIKTQPDDCDIIKKRHKGLHTASATWTPYLPTELWVFIFKMFSFKSMYLLASVCRDWAGLWRRYISQKPERRQQMYESMDISYGMNPLEMTSDYEHCLVGAAAAGDIKWVKCMMNNYGLCSTRSHYRKVVSHKLYRFWALGDPDLFWKIRWSCDLQNFWELRVLRGLVKLGKVKHIQSWMQQASMKKTLYNSHNNFANTFVPGSMEALNWILNYNGKDTHKNLVNSYAMAVLAMKRGDRVLFMEAVCRNKGSKFYTHDIGDIWRWASYYLCFWALPLLTKLPKSLMSFLLPILSVSKSRLHKETPFGLVREVYLKQAVSRYLEIRYSDFETRFCEIIQGKIAPQAGDHHVELSISLSPSEWRELYLACAKQGDVAALEFFTEEFSGKKAIPTYLAPYVECANVESWKWFWGKGFSVGHLDQLDWIKIGGTGGEALAEYMIKNPCTHREALMSATMLLNIMASGVINCKLFRFITYLCLNTKGSLLVLEKSYRCVNQLQRLYRCVGGKNISKKHHLVVPKYKDNSSKIEWPRWKCLAVAVRHLLETNQHICNGFCKSMCLCCGRTQKKEKKV